MRSNFKKYRFCEHSEAIYSANAFAIISMRVAKNRCVQLIKFIWEIATADEKSTSQ